jgi:kynurenine formamidase
MSDVDTILAQLGSTRMFDLEHERYSGAATFSAHWPGFVYTLHRHHEKGQGQARTSASGTITMQEHSGTHIDALCHQAVEMKMFGGIDVVPDVQTAHGLTQLGVQTISPILRRGLLLDVARARGVECLAPGYLVTAADLQAATDAQGVVPRTGDCLLVRTGTGRNYADPERYKEWGRCRRGWRTLARVPPAVPMRRRQRGVRPPGEL